MTNKICISCAMRGRYKEDGNTEQHLEIHDEFANCVTCVQKDCLILEVSNEHRDRK